MQHKLAIIVVFVVMISTLVGAQESSGLYKVSTLNLQPNLGGLV